MKRLPQARNEQIVVQHTNDEVLVYDLKTNQAFCLNSTSAIVFDHCDGLTTLDDLKNKYKFTDDLIHFTLDKLSEKNLLVDYQANKYFAGLSRREVVKRVGFASLLTLPLISELIAPTAAHAASGASRQANGTTCSTSAQCTSGFCVATESAAGVSSGNECCFANSAPGGAPLGSTGRVRSNSTSETTCAGMIQRSYCCTNQTSFSNPGSGSPGACTCT